MISTIHNGEEAKSKEELNALQNKRLEAFLAKPISKKDSNELDLTKQLHESFTEPLVGYYLKKANRIDKLQAKDPDQINCIRCFYDWTGWPARNLKAYGCGDKFKHWIALRFANDVEIEQYKSIKRSVWFHFFNWNDMIEYHIRHGFEYDFILDLASKIKLDNCPLDLDLVNRAAQLPKASRFSYKPVKKTHAHKTNHGRQFELPL